jgi:hypothetical protein
MSMDDINFDEIEEIEESPQSEDSGNRTFLLVAGILGSILVLSLILMAVYAMMIVPNRQAAQSTELAGINAQNTQVAMDSGLTAVAQAWTATPTNTRTPIPETATPSITPVLAATNTPAAGLAADDPRTATVAALFTQQAENLLTTTPVSTLLPDTGFADDVGILGLVTLAGALVLIIFLARRLRTVN